jgi:hypothetical protein
MRGRKYESMMECVNEDSRIETRKEKKGRRKDDMKHPTRR